MRESAGRAFAPWGLLLGVAAAPVSGQYSCPAGIPDRAGDHALEVREDALVVLTEASMNLLERRWLQAELDRVREELAQPGGRAR